MSLASSLLNMFEASDGASTAHPEVLRPAQKITRMITTTLGINHRDWNGSTSADKSAKGLMKGRWKQVSDKEHVRYRYRHGEWGWEVYSKPTDDGDALVAAFFMRPSYVSTSDEEDAMMEIFSRLKNSGFKSVTTEDRYFERSGWSVKAFQKVLPAAQPSSVVEIPDGEVEDVEDSTLDDFS